MLRSKTGATRLLAALLLAAGCGSGGRRPPTGIPPAATQPAPAPAKAEESSPVVSPDLDRLLADLRTGNKQTADRATSALTALGSAVVPAILPLLEEPRWEVRWRGVNTLGYLRDRRATEALVERVLADESPHVRWRSLWAISSVEAGAGTARDALALALDDPDSVRRWRAVVGLSFFADPRCLPKLPDGLASADRFIRFEAVYGLQVIHDDTTSARLEPLLRGDPVDRVRRQIVLTLGSICDRQARELLAGALVDADEDIRWRAASALGRCGDASYREALVAQRTVESDAEVKTAIDAALASLADR